MDDAAAIIRDAFAGFRAEFRAVNRRARRRFEKRDWHGVQADAALRLDLYRRAVDLTVAALRAALGVRVADREAWIRLKASYSRLVAGREDRELAETFFNSATRREFATVGVDRAIEFVDSDFDAPAGPAARPLFECFPRGPDAADLLRRVLRRFAFDAPYASLDGDARAGAERVDAALRPLGGHQALDRAEIVSAVFYRNKGAYLVGRLRGGFGLVPFVLCLLHPDEGVALDAVLLDEGAVSLVFSFTRSYFKADAERPSELVAFLKTLMPLKRVAELYIALGFNKHGKTEMYRDVLRHLASTSERFELAKGDRGMVMAVFTLPSLDLVFKVIRDRFAEPKSTTRAEVMGKYDIVFRHDRAGRLIDAQEFEHLQFPRARFAEPVLRELLETAAGSVSLAGDQVAIRHLYAERRLQPLNLYVRDASPDAARDAILDYGQAIRDLASTNVFPGDVLLKNFGVTRHRRVVFYDYDELALLTDCRFRELPAPQGPEQETAGEPWFYVAPNDLFPEEFARFLGLPPQLEGLFMDAHRELFDVRFWRDLQARLRAGEIVDIFAYPASQRLARGR